MQFKQPEVLYALLFLLIPLLVHLFQLRRFQKEDFTNVKFLKRISKETRKSSRLKKWLVLCTRMLALTSIILAFTQPYIPAQEEGRRNSRKIIYLDNSHSMQAPGIAGDLLATAVQDLLQNLPEDETFDLLTNDAEYKRLDTEEVKVRLQDIEFSATAMDYQELQLKFTQLAEENEQKEVAIISDFQQNFNFPEEAELDNTEYHLIFQHPRDFLNLSLDSLYISEQTPDFTRISFRLSNNSEINEPVPVAVFDGDELLSRKSFEVEAGNYLEGDFELKREKILEGRLEIEDNGLQYDNLLYFSLNLPESLKGMVITAPETDASFLERIFVAPEFNFRIFTANNLDYNRLATASFVILNELEEVPPALANSLQKTYDEGGVLIVIPSEENRNLNTFLSGFNAPGYGKLIEQERLMTNIAFDHPLLTGVFEETVENFDYPAVQRFYQMQPGGNTVLSFQDQRPFLLEHNKVFIFSAPLNSENSNFRNSPLIVPVFYNMGREALSPPRLYYQVQQSARIEIPIESSGDEVVSITSASENFIPRQQAFSGKVEIMTEDLPETAGNFNIQYKGKPVGMLSYNYARQESTTSYMQPDEIQHAKIYSSAKEYFETSRSVTSHTVLWKWFVILALIFLTVEMLLLKYFT